jgi:lactoylglutathione lyase
MACKPFASVLQHRRGYRAAVAADLRIELFPADLDRFLDFYVRVLRFSVDADERVEGRQYVSVRRGGVRIGAARAWAPVDEGARAVPQGVELVVEVDDLHAERDAVAAAGWPLAAEIERQPWGLDDFRLLDPDGYPIRLTTSG